MTVIEVWLQEQAKRFILVELYNKFSFKMLGSELFVFPHLSLSLYQHSQIPEIMLYDTYCHDITYIKQR